MADAAKPWGGGCRKWAYFLLHKRGFPPSDGLSAALHFAVNNNSTASVALIPLQRLVYIHLTWHASKHPAAFLKRVDQGLLTADGLDHRLPTVDILHIHQWVLQPPAPTNDASEHVVMIQAVATNALESHITRPAYDSIDWSLHELTMKLPTRTF